MPRRAYRGRVRLAGVTDAARGTGLHDHMCWSYEDRDELRHRVVEFLADGLRLGQQLYYVGGGRAELLMADLHGLDGLDPVMRAGGLQIRPIESMYGTDWVAEPDEQVRAYAAATEDALAAGFTGLRVAAEASPLVRTPEQLEAFARYEHQVDGYSARHPFAALCAYNRVELGDHVVRQLACMHPAVSANATPFRLHAATDGAAASLGGELDLASRGLFPVALRRADLRPAGGEIVIDATGLTFVDHHSLLVLDELGRSRRAVVVLRTPLRSIGRMVTLLELDCVRAQVAA